jgi:hypothetical protein
MSTREKKRAHRINVVKGHLPCFPLVTSQSIHPCSLESSRTTKRLNNNDQKKVIQTINK